MSRILLIDDDAQVNEVVRATLEMLGHSVNAIERVTELEATVREFEPDFTLVDYMLPGCSGLDVLREIERIRPGTVRYLATGMADFALLRQALDAGAFSMLSKPYRVLDLVGLFETGTLLGMAIQAEREPVTGDALTLSGSGPLQPDVIARLISFAAAAGAAPDVARRRLPVVAIELLKNVVMHGGGEYCCELRNAGTHLRLQVSGGPGFEWQRAVARARTATDKARAAGLQIVLALVPELAYEEQGRVACVKLSKEECLSS